MLPAFLCSSARKSRLFSCVCVLLALILLRSLVSIVHPIKKAYKILCKNNYARLVNDE
jgi:hypothetical protein